MDIFNKVNIRRLEYQKLYDEFKIFVDNWQSALNIDVELTNDVNSVSMCPAVELAYNGMDINYNMEIINLNMTNDIFVMRLFIIYKIFPHIFEDSKYISVKGKRLVIGIDHSDACFKYIKHALINLNKLINFLIPYVESFIAGVGHLKTTDCTLNLKADGINPLSVLRLGVVSYTECNHHGLTLETHEFSNQFDINDKYLRQIVYFMLFDKFTKNCDTDNPWIEIKDPAPIYYLLYNETKYSIIHQTSGNTNYNFYIEVTDGK